MQITDLNRLHLHQKLYLKRSFEMQLFFYMYEYDGRRSGLLWGYMWMVSDATLQ